MPPAIVSVRVEHMLQGWQRPPNTPEDFVGALERTGLPEAAAALRELFAAG